MSTEPGKRYVCSSCGSEFVVTRAGDGTPECCGRPVNLKVAAAGASSENG